MNGIEAVFFSAGIVLVVCYSLCRINRSWWTVLIAAIVIPLLFLSINETTQFLTVDEQYIILEPVSLKTSPMGQWNLNALRTTDAIVGTVMHGFRWLTRWPLERYWMVAKGVHWLLGLILLMAIGDLISRRFVPERDRVLFFALFMPGMMLLPTTLLALKIFNYDLFSLLLGIYALVWLAVGVRDQIRRACLIAVAVAACATQEKVIAMPVLFAAMAGCAFQIPAVSSASLRRFTMAWSGNLLLGGAAVLAVTAVSHLVIIVNRFGGSPYLHFNPAKIIGPYMGWTWPLIRMAGGDSLLDRCILLVRGHPVELLCAMVLAVAVLIPLSAVVAFRLRAGLRAAATGRTAGIERGAWIVETGLFLVVLCVGIAGTWRINAHWVPSGTLASPGVYMPQVSFNAMTVVFGASSSWSHLAMSVGWACTVFANMIPSAVVVLIVTGMFIRRKQSGTVLGSRLFEHLTVIGCLGIVLLFGLTQTPVGNRYLNLFTAIIVMIAVVRVTDALGAIKRWKALCCAGTVYLLTFLGILPFGPLYAPFRPLWSPPDKSNPADGRINVSWPGWGEEAMILGKRIAKDRTTAGIGNTPWRIRCNYWSAWLDKPGTVTIYQPGDTVPGPQHTSDDYYLFNRCGLAQRFTSAPPAIPPYATLSFRGYETAWVYRGDALAAAGYHVRQSRQQ